MIGSREAFERLESGESLAVPRSRGLLRLSGPQRVWFLQNTITSDVDAAPSGSWVESCFLDVKGKVVAHFRVGMAAQELFVDVDPPGTEPLVDWFVRYRFRTKVDIEQLSPECLTVVGPQAETLAGPGVFDPATLAFGGRLGEVFVTDVYRPGDVLRSLDQAGEDLLDVLRIRAGLAAFGRDYGPDTLPQEAGLTSIVSVDKGCYVGQEVMARLHFRGHVNKSVRPVVFEGAADPDALVGAVLMGDGRSVGRVTSAAAMPDGGAAGIAMLRVEVPKGAMLRVEVPKGAMLRVEVPKGAIVDVEGGVRAIAGPLPAGTKTTKGPPRRGGGASEEV